MIYEDCCDRASIGHSGNVRGHVPFENENALLGHGLFQFGQGDASVQLEDFADVGGELNDVRETEFGPMHADGHGWPARRKTSSMCSICAEAYMESRSGSAAGMQN